MMRMVTRGLSSRWVRGSWQALVALLVVSSVGGTVAHASAQEVRRTLRVGMLDGPPHYALGAIHGVSILPGGRLLALDFQAKRLHIYDEQGEHLLSFGGSGSGPGEFQIPAPPIVTRDAILVYDQQLRRIARFTLDGDHLETTPFSPEGSQFSTLIPLRDGMWLGEIGAFSSSELKQMIAGTLDRSAVGLREVVVLHDERVDTIARIRPGSMFWFDRDRGSPMGPVQEHRLANEGFSAVAGDSLVVIVDAVRGNLGWYQVEQPGLRRLAARSLNLPPRAADLSFLEAYGRELRSRVPQIERLDFIAPSHDPYFASAIVDSDGAVWLNPATGNDHATISNQLLIVPMDGSPTYTITVPSGFRPAAVSGNRIVGVYKDELGVQYIEIYEFGRRR